MMQKNDKGLWQSSLLTSLGVQHAYGDRHTSPDTIVTTGDQVHGTRVVQVTPGDRGKVLSGVDGLVSTDRAIGVTYADCVPILAVDVKEKIIGTAHAGWKGTLRGISKNLITSMVSLGAHLNSIYISIGPHISMCCYSVHADRAHQFEQIFGINQKIASVIQGTWHLDIGFANFHTLIQVGIPVDHIDAPPICTSCMVSDFYSFRADAKDTFSTQLGVISL